jgi:hypothetical protein
VNLVFYGDLEEFLLTGDVAGDDVDDLFYDLFSVLACEEGGARVMFHVLRAATQKDEPTA